MVQNSTSVRYQLTISGDSNDKYSCEVNGQDGLDKREIIHIIECKHLLQQLLVFLTQLRFTCT